MKPLRLLEHNGVWKVMRQTRRGTSQQVPPAILGCRNHFYSVELAAAAMERAEPHYMRLDADRAKGRRQAARPRQAGQAPRICPVCFGVSAAPICPECGGIE